MIASLHIQTKLRNGCTYVQGIFCTPPFKVLDIREDKRNPQLELMLMTSSPGILDEDLYTLKIEVAESCDLKIRTQAYQRIFTMLKGAGQDMQVHVAENASFCFIPHPMVPHAGAKFVTRNKIYLETGSSLIWGEVLTCGRKLNGEVFVFSKYQSITEIYMNQRLLLRENLMIKPSEINVHGIGQMEGFSHQATLISVAERSTECISKIQAMLNSEQGITYGISKAEGTALLIRIFGYKAEQLYNCLHAIGAMLSNTVAYAK
jgi:urease accessory protein